MQGFLDLRFKDRLVGFGLQVLGYEYRPLAVLCVWSEIYGFQTNFLDTGGLCATIAQTHQCQPTPTHATTNLPTYQPTNQPTNRPTDQPTNRPTDQPTNRPNDRPSNQPSNQPTNQPVKPQTLNRFIECDNSPGCRRRCGPDHRKQQPL